MGFMLFRLKVGWGFILLSLLSSSAFALYPQNAEPNTMRFIAGQCDLIGGAAVPESRYLLIFVDSLMGDYSNACNGINAKNSQIIKDSEANIIISPNPNRGEFQIRMNKEIYPYLRIINSIGQTVFQMLIFQQPSSGILQQVQPV